MSYSGNPANVAAPTPPTGGVYDTAAGLYNQAAAGPNIGQFMNPYTSMVTGTALNDLERQRQMQMNTIGAQASQAGAFGGSRHGVAEALTNQGFAQQGAQTFANLQNQGFNTALGAAQNQQGINANLANLGFGFGNQIGQQQAGYGAQARGLNQALMDAAKSQYGAFTGGPASSLSGPLAATGAANMGQGSTTQTQQPGLLNILGLALGL